MPITTFDNTQESLQDLLTSLRTGKTQLPEFQRDWVWDDERVRALLSSVLLSYPIGVVMLLQTGNPSVRFKARPIEGVVLPTPVDPERFVLDGQQRLTALYQSLLSGQPVKTKDARGNQIKRWYYLDIGKALSSNNDREDAIVAIPEDKKIRNFRGEVEKDYSTTEKECAAGLFPLSIVFNSHALMKWQRAYLVADHDSSGLEERGDRLADLQQRAIQPIQQYSVPLIQLRKETPKEAVCLVFERVNQGGMPLTVFDLLTATYAADDFRLRDDWNERHQRLMNKEVLKGVGSSDFLQTVTLLATWARRNAARRAGTPEDKWPGISCKRAEILRLPLYDYKEWAEPAMLGYLRAARFLHGQMILTSKDVPYRTQLTPLAAILAVLGDRAENDGVRSKLAKWFWCGVFGELYGGAIESRFASDLPQVLEWVDVGPEPTTVRDAVFNPERLLTLRSRNSAAYKGIQALLMRGGARDFRTGEVISDQIYFDEQVDIHHIFPKRWCDDNSRRIPPKVSDCVVNKTLLSSKTNRKIGSNAPSVYLPRLQEGAGIASERMNEILQSHLIEPALLRQDDFEHFFEARRKELLRLIENAMGKPMPRDIHVEELSAIEEVSEEVGGDEG